MTDKRTDQLPAAAALTGDEILAIDQGGSSRRTTTGDIATIPHDHAIDDVAGLAAALAGKAASAHGHAIADVAGLSAALAELEGSSGASDTFYAADFGVVPGTGADQSAGIQAAINAAAAAGGGVVKFAKGDFTINSTLTMATGVFLEGVRSRSPSNTATATGTRLIWNGAAAAGTVMVLFETSTTGTPPINYGGGLRNISLDGGAKVHTALKINSWLAGRVQCLDIRNINPSLDSRAILLATQASGALSDPSDTQEWVFEQFFIRIAGGAFGITLTGVIGANTSFNTFRRGWIIHENQSAIFVYHGDNNGFADIRTFREAGGTGRSLSIAGNTSSQANINDANSFRNCYFGAPMAILGTESGYNLGKAAGNKLIDLDASNGSATPTSAGVQKESGGSPIIWRTSVQATFTSTA